MGLNCKSKPAEVAEERRRLTKLEKASETVVAELFRKINERKK